MRPLQDECTPTSYEDVAGLFLTDMGRSVRRLTSVCADCQIDTLFSEFDREPIGVASLAQVHVAVDRETGRRVAVKLMRALAHVTHLTAQTPISRTLLASTC